MGIGAVNAIVLVIALAAAGGQTDSSTVTVSVLSVQATNEGRAAKQDDNAATESAKPKRSAATPFLQQGFAPGLRDKPKPKNNGEERHFEAGLEGIRDAAETLPYDTYKKIKTETETISFNKQSTFKIDERYKLRLTPLAKDEQNRVRVNVSVDEQTVRNGSTQTVTALETTSAIAPNKYLVLGGRLPLEEGQLVIFVSAK